MCSVWIPATCTAAIGRASLSRPALMMPALTPKLFNLSLACDSNSFRWAMNMTFLLNACAVVMMSDATTVLPPPVGTTMTMRRMPAATCLLYSSTMRRWNGCRIMTGRSAIGDAAARPVVRFRWSP